jgi:uncharacterized protein YbjQ (UPF0145 family)
VRALHVTRLGRVVDVVQVVERLGVRELGDALVRVVRGLGRLVRLRARRRRARRGRVVAPARREEQRDGEERKAHAHEAVVHSASVKVDASLSASAHRAVEPARVATTDVLAGHRIVRTLGVARGLVVRSRSLFGRILAFLQSLLGQGTLYARLAERARQEANEMMLKHAAELGANAVVGARFDANEIAPGVTEVLCYGTAVVVEETHTSDH